MKRIPVLLSVSLLVLFTAGSTAAQDWAWWEPFGPEAGDSLTFTFDVDNSSEITGTPTQLYLWWGHDSWTAAPDSLWPEGSVYGDVGSSVKSPMNSVGEGRWKIKIPTLTVWQELNFVFTTGTQWAHVSGGADWELPLDGTNGDYPPPDTGDAEVLPDTWHTFSLDTRSPNVTYGVDDITAVYARGTFNSWDLSAPLEGPDDRGVYSADVQISVGENEYKFYFDLGQGDEDWISDPDNPMTNPDDNNNSVVVAVADTLPYVDHLTPRDGTIYAVADTIRITGLARTADDGKALSGDPVITASETISVMDLAMEPSGAFSAWLLAPDISGPMTITCTVNDDSGRTGGAQTLVGVFSDGTGFHAVDPVGDAIGDGDYVTSADSNADVDLTSLDITANATLDSLLFEVGIASPSEETRVMFQLMTGLTGSFISPTTFGTEMNTPTWTGRGVQIVLANPASSTYDPDYHNRLIVSDNPFESTAAVTMVSDTSFKVALDDLEQILGSFNAEWYLGVYSFLETTSGTVDHSYEITEADGGIEAVYDPDAFDMIFTDTRDLQTRILANNTSDKWAALEAAGRGFGLLDPTVVDAGLSTAGPTLRFITRNFETVKSAKTIWCNRSDGAVTYLRQRWDGGGTVISSGGGPGDFSHNVTLRDGVNEFRIYSLVDLDTVWSPTLEITYITDKAPHAFVYSTVNGSTITLDASECTDPQEQTLSFSWMPDADNPASVTLSDPYSATPTLSAPSTLGEYYFDLIVEDTDGNTTPARAMFTVHSDSVEPFDISRSAPWVRDAVVYEIFPRAFSPGDLSGITARMDEIAALGVTTIWLMPIYPGPSDHGYAVADYYGIESDYGTFDDFATLMEEAHARGLRVILDMVLNHSSIDHPFMLDRLELGTRSNYYDWYATSFIPDSTSHLLTLDENYSESGDYTYYSNWTSLPNLALDDPDLKHYLIEMCKWWVTEYDVDGFRCDVAWGVEARNPQFWQDWRKELKTIKPEVMLLAEAPVTEFTYLTNRFDMAYDWSLFHDHVSDGFNGSTPYGINTRVRNYGYAFPDYTYPFRFMENHDENRFLVNNSLQQDISTATFLLTIPGVPLIYAGQEVGETSQRGTIDWDDNYDLSFIYRRLCEARAKLPSLRTPDLTNLTPTLQNDVYVYSRFAENEAPVITLLNVEDETVTITFSVPTGDFGLADGVTYYLTDILGGTSIAVTTDDLSEMTETLGAKGVLVYAITDTAMVLSTPENPELPLSFALHPNYPNPFNPETLIRFDLPTNVVVKLAVYNILGQKVRTLVDHPMTPGHHVIRFDGRSDKGLSLSSGVYFYRMEAGKFTQSRKMVLVK